MAKNENTRQSKPKKLYALQFTLVYILIFTRFVDCSLLYVVWITPYSAFRRKHCMLWQSHLSSLGKGNYPLQSISQALLGVKGGKQTSPSSDN